MKIFALISLSFILAGCAVENDHTEFHGMGLTYQSNIETVSANEYSSAVEAAPAAGRVKGAVSYATMNALKYCEKKNKSLKVLSTDVDTNFIINGVARVKFTCI